MLNRKMRPIAAAVGAAFATSFATNAVADDADPFEASLLEDSVILAAGHKEGGCGEDESAEAGEEGKCGEGKCGEDESAEDESAEAGEEGESEE